MKHFLFILLFPAMALAEPIEPPWFGAKSKRFSITNEVENRRFSIEADFLPPQYPPEWGLKAREIPCSEVPENELGRITKRESREIEPPVYEDVPIEPVATPTPAPTPVEEVATGEPTPEATPVPTKRVVVKPAVIAEFCSLPDQFTIVSTDITAEIAAAKAKEAALKTAIEDVKKSKKSSYSNAERDKILNALVEAVFGN